VIAHLVWFAETYEGMMERGLRAEATQETVAES